MKKLLLLNQDSEPLFEVLPQNLTAKIERVIVGTIRTDFFKLDVSDGEYTFTAGLFLNKQDAERNLKALYSTLRKAKRGKYKFDGWQPTDAEISAIELLDELKYSARRKEYFFDVAERVLSDYEELDDEDIPF